MVHRVFTRNEKDMVVDAMTPVNATKNEVVIREGEVLGDGVLLEEDREVEELFGEVRHA